MQWAWQSKGMSASLAHEDVPVIARCCCLLLVRLLRISCKTFQQRICARGLPAQLASSRIYLPHIMYTRITSRAVTPACACRYGQSPGSGRAPPAEHATQQDAAEQGLAAAVLQRSGAPRQLSPRQRGLRQLLQQGLHPGVAAGGSRREPSPQHAAPQPPSDAAAAAAAGGAGRGPGAEPGAETPVPGGRAPQPPPPPPPPPPQPGVPASGGQQRLPSGGQGSVPQAVSPFAPLATKTFDDAPGAGGSASSV